MSTHRAISRVHGLFSRSGTNIRYVFRLVINSAYSRASSVTDDGSTAAPIRREGPQHPDTPWLAAT